MEPEKAALVSASWQAIRNGDGDMAMAFYARLLELEPRLADLFIAADIESQAVKFTSMLAEMVAWIHDPARHERSLVESGLRHRRLGVVSRHYRVAGEALLWALDRSLPRGLDSDTRAAWAEAYTRMTRVMQNGSTSSVSRRNP